MVAARFLSFKTSSIIHRLTYHLNHHMSHNHNTEMVSPRISILRSTLLLWLGSIMLLQSIGIAGKYLFVNFEADSQVYELLFFDWRWPEPIAQSIDDGGAWVCLIAAGLIFAASFSRCLPVAGKKKIVVSIRFAGIRMAEIVAAWLIVGWMFVLALTEMIRGGQFAELSLGEHAVRFCLPLFFWMVLMSEASSCESAADPLSDKSIADQRSGWLMWGISLMSLATAATFAVHGLKALAGYGYFADLILLSDKHWLGIEPAQATVEKWLIVIGIVDLLVAGLLLFTRWRVVAIYMVLWALVTAISRMTAFGFAAWPETLIRSANWGAPLVLWWCFQTVYRTNGPNLQVSDSAQPLAPVQPRLQT